LVETAKLSRTSGAVYWPLLYGKAWAGAPVPAYVLRLLAPPRVAREISPLGVVPDALVGRPEPRDESIRVLRDLIVDLSLRSGCPLSEQMTVVRQRLFPPPRAVGHLPSSVTASRLRYSAHLVRPARAAHAALAFGRLASRKRPDAPSVDGSAGVAVLSS